MIKFIFLKEPFPRNNISPLHYRVTTKSEDKLSGDHFSISKMERWANVHEDCVDQHDQYQDAFWEDPTGE